MCSIQENYTSNSGQNVHRADLSAFSRTFTYVAAHPDTAASNRPRLVVSTTGHINMADFSGLVRTTIIIQANNMAFERNPSFVLEALFSLPDPPVIQVMGDFGGLRRSRMREGEHNAPNDAVYTHDVTAGGPLNTLGEVPIEDDVPQELGNTDHTNQQNVHNAQMSPFTRVFSYTADHPTHTNQPYPALRNPEIVNMADFGGLVRTTIIIQVQNMAFERNPSFESDLADVLEALFSLPATDSYTGESTGAPAIIQVMRVSLPEEDKSLMDMLAGKWTVEVLSQEQDFVRASVRPPLGLGRRAKKFFASGCGIHNESFATAPLIMMDRHQFYIPYNEGECHAAVRQYSEEITRGLFPDGLPSRPLKIKLEACKEGMDFLDEFPQR